MTGRVEEDSERRPWLYLGLRRAEFDRDRFALVEVAHHQIEMHLLWHRLSGPLGRPVVGDLLE